MALLEYEFKIVGMNAVNAAFASLERRAAQHNVRIRREFAGVSRGAGRVAGGGSGGVSSGGVTTVAARSAASAEKASLRASVAAEKAASRERIAIVRAEEKEKARLKRDAAKGEVAWQRNVARQNRIAFQEEKRERTRAVRRAERQALSVRASREQFARSVGVGVQRIGSTVGGLATGAAGIVGLAGTAAFANAVTVQASESAQASKLVNQTAKKGESVNSLRERRGVMLKQMQGIRGFTGGEAMTGVERFVTKTGDVDTATRLLPQLAQLSLATGTDLGDLSEAAGQAYNPLTDAGVKGGDRDKQIMDVLRTLAGQGNIGAVEIKDMAKELGGLNAAMVKTSGPRAEMMGVAGAMAQAAIARGGAASAPETTTAVTRFMQDVTTKSGSLEKMGVQAFTDKSKTKLRDPRELIADVLDKTGGDLTKIGDIFGAYGERALGGFSPLYAEAESKKKGSGRGAVMAEFDRFMKATLTEQDQKSRGESALTTEEAQFKEAMKQFNAEVGSKLLPAVTKIIPAFERLTPHIGVLAEKVAAAVEFFTKNPLQGLGIVIAAAAAKEVASAGLGMALNKALAMALATSAPGAAGAAAANGATAAAGGAARTVGLLAGTGLAAAGGAAAAGIGSLAYSLYDSQQYLAANSAGGNAALTEDLARAGRISAAARQGKGGLEAIRGEKNAALDAARWGGGETGFAAADPLGVANFARNAADNVAGLFGVDIGQGYDDQQRRIQLGKMSEDTVVRASKAEGTILGGGSPKLDGSADKLAAAADKLSGAADKVGAGLNRGNTPSPVKN